MSKITLIVWIESFSPRYHQNKIDFTFTLEDPTGASRPVTLRLECPQTTQGEQTTWGKEFKIILSSNKATMKISAKYHTRICHTLKFFSHPSAVKHKWKLRRDNGVWMFSFLWTEELSPLPDTKIECKGMPDDPGPELSEKEIKLLSLSSLESISKRALPHNQVLSVFKILKEKSFPCLRSINFHGNQVCCEGAEIFAEILSLIPSLTLLNLGRCRIGDPGLKALSKALAKPSCALLELELTDNFFGDIGGVCLGESLSTNIQLQRLDIRQNRLGDQTFMAFGQSLQKNTSLITLRINSAESRNAVTTVGLLALAKGLSLNSKICALQVDFKSIFTVESLPELRKEFLTLLSSNISLTHVPLGVNLYFDADFFCKEDKPTEKWWCPKCTSSFPVTQKICSLCAFKDPKGLHKRKPRFKRIAMKKEKPRNPVLSILLRNFKRMILDTMYHSMKGTVPDVMVTMIMDYAEINEETFTRKPNYSD